MQQIEGDSFVKRTNSELRHRVLPTIAIASNEFEGVVFDLDDLLVGTQYLCANPGFHLPLYAEAFEEILGVKLSPELKKGLITRINQSNSREILSTIHFTLLEFGVTNFENCDPEEIGAIIEPYRKDKILGAARRGECPMLPGARQLLESLALSSKKMAIYSSNRRSINGSLIDIVFDSKLKELFSPEFILFGDDVVALGGKRKPDPFGFVEIARRMKTAPNKLIAFDDSCEGLEGSLRAGYRMAIGVDGGKKSDFSSIGAEDHHRLKLVAGLEGVLIV